MSIFSKDPDAVLDYSFDWSAWLGGSETISSDKGLKNLDC